MNEEDVKYLGNKCVEYLSDSTVDWNVRIANLLMWLETTSIINIPHDINYVDVIGYFCGWKPIQPNQTMTITFSNESSTSSHYRIKRIK